MLVDSFNLVFIHIPKTGGNAIQTLMIEHGLTTDKKRNLAGRDGVHRFEINGTKTFTKHQTLRDYLSLDEGSDFTNILAIYREPTERLLSLYMSPNRWIRAYIRGTPLRVPFFLGKTRWREFLDYREKRKSLPSPRQFSRFIRYEKNSSSYLFQKPTLISSGHDHRITILDFGNLEKNLQEFLAKEMRYLKHAQLRHINPGTVARGPRKPDMTRYQALVKDSHHSDDWKLEPFLNKTFPLSDFFGELEKLVG